MRYCLFFTSFLFLICNVQGQETGGLRRKLHIDESIRTVSDCFRHIHDAGIVLSFNPDEIDMENRIPESLSGDYTAAKLLKRVLDTKKYEIKPIEAQQKILIVRKRRKFTVSGYIREKGSEESLIAATVYAKEAKQGCVSNAYGFYSIALPEGEVSLAVSYVGYSPQSVAVDLRHNTRMDIYLEPVSTQLSTVEVTAPPDLYAAEHSTINLAEANNIPQLFGTNDAMKHIQLLAGIGGGLSGSSRLQVRGGKADNNLILLDDVPLYNYNHFTGLISIFNSDALKNVNFYKGRFPARYGGRLSSVADIRMRNGDMSRYRAGASVDMATVSTFVEGPIKKETTSFLFSARRSWIDMFTGLWGKDNRLNFSLHDVNLKINYRTSHSDRLFFSVYSGADNFTDAYSANKKDKSLSWGSGFAALRWNHVFNDKVFMNTTAYVSRFDNRLTGEASQNDSPQDSLYSRFKYNIREYSLHSDIDYYNEYYHIRAGIGFTGNRFESGRHYADSTMPTGGNITNAFQSTAYMENRISLGEKMKMNIGLNYSFYKTEKTLFHLFDPRIQLTYSFYPRSSVFIGFSQMNQFFHQISVAGISFPYEVRMPSTRVMKPETAKLYEAGFGISSKDGNHRLSGTLFYNRQERILTYRPAQDLFGNKLAPDPDNQVFSGEKKAKGIESAYTGKQKAFDWNLSFSLSEVKERFPELNNGLFYSSPEHVEMLIRSMLNWKINSVSTITTIVTCNSGKYITVPSYAIASAGEAGGGNAEGSETQVTYWFDRLSNYKLPYNYQFDVGYTYKRNYSDKKETVFQFGIYNLLGKAAPFQVDVEKGKQGVTIRKTVMPHCIPYVRLGFKF